jgi:glutathione peroxidase
MSIYDITINGLDGSADVLGAQRGKVTLAVNVASKCGLTPQYAGLQRLQDRYADDGFTVVGFPCNQFGGQEPGTPAEIAEFCSTNYSVTFPVSEKIDVNGAARHPVYAALVDTADASGHNGDVRWNFEKFLIDRDGTVLARFSPTAEPEGSDIVKAIEGAIG